MWWERSGLSETQALFIHKWLRLKVKKWRGAYSGLHSRSANKLNKKRFSGSKRRDKIKKISMPLPRNVPIDALVSRYSENLFLESFLPDRKNKWKNVMRRQPHHAISCENFSFIDNPFATIKTLQSIAEAEAQFADVRLDFDDRYCLDIGAFLVLEEMWQHMTPVFSGGNISPSIARVLNQIGLRKALGWKLLGNDLHSYGIIPFPFQRQQRPASAERSATIEPPRAAKITSNLVGFIDETLKKVALVSLTTEARRVFKKLVGEILDNAETHGAKDKRGGFTIAGFLAHRVVNDKDVFRFHLGFLSIGQTIASSLDSAPREVTEEMDAYVLRHEGRRLSKENLRTVYALRDGVTRLGEKINVAHGQSLGGTGLADILDFFSSLVLLAERSEKPKLAIVSGATYIMVQEPYLKALRVSDDAKPGSVARRELWFNEANSIESPPDREHVLTLPGEIPGTLVTLAFNIDPNLVEAIQNENH